MIGRIRRPTIARMQPPKKNLWKEYLGYLWVGAIMATIMAVFFKEDMPWGPTVAVAAMSGFTFGTLFFSVNYFFPRAKFRSFWLTCIVRSLIILAIMLVGMCIVVPLAITMRSRLSVFDHRVWAFFLDFVRTRFPIWLPSGLLLSFCISAFFQIDRKVGPGVVFKWLTSKYPQPREEERIFMFLDLKNSTTLAEKLGNLRFSQL